MPDRQWDMLQLVRRLFQHRLLLASVMAGLAVAPIALSQRTSRAELRFQEAHRKETIDGDLKSAIDLYRRAIAEAGSNRAIAAQALLRMGECHEKLGDTEARKAYERLVRNFGDQKSLAETARTRLAALGGAGRPSGITLRKVWALDHGSLQGAPSPDGRYHSFYDPDTGDLALRDLTMGQNRRLTNKGTWKESREYAAASVISGDGKQIAYAWYNKEGFYELRVCGIDGSNPRTVYRDKEVVHWIEPYQWTADGKQILAVLMKAKKEWQFALIPSAGGPVRILKTPVRDPWHPSLSPDGRFLVYTAWKVDGHGPDGDIFLLPMEGGPAVPLVRSPAEDHSPVWTPAGNKVLFVSDRTGSNGFWTIDVLEGKPQGIPQLLKDGVGSVGSPVRTSGFTRQGAFYYSTSTAIHDVYVTELDPAEGKMLRPPAPVAKRWVGSNLAPSWSPDGRLLAYYRRGDAYKEEPPTLVIFSVETGEARDVPVRLVPEILAPVRWFPDGKSLLASVRESDPLNQVAFYRVDAQTGDHRLVRESPGPGPAGAELSPDGKMLFFFTGGEQKLWGGIIARDIETGEEREIARVPFMWPENGWTELAISPDGRYLTFRSPVDESWTAVRLVPTTGGEVRELYRFQVQSEPALFGQLSWTPDGRNVLFVRSTGKDGMPELWRMPIAGGEPQRTGLSMKGMRVVAVHPDGRRIAFDSSQGSGAPGELWVLENIPGAAESKPVAAAK